MQTLLCSLQVLTVGSPASTPFRTAVLPGIVRATAEVVTGERVQEFQQCLSGVSIGAVSGKPENLREVRCSIRGWACTRVTYNLGGDLDI